MGLMTRRCLVPPPSFSVAALGLAVLALPPTACNEAQREDLPNPLVSVSEGWVRAMAVSVVERARQGTAEPEPSRPVPATAEAGESSSGVSTAGYLVIRNHGRHPDRLLSAATDAAGSVEVHRTVMEGDIMRMRPVSDLPIPAGGSVVFEPGGLHLMLRDLRRTLSDGEHLTLMLHFERGGELMAELVVGQGFQG